MVELNQIEPNLYSLPVKVNTSYTVGTYILNISLVVLAIVISFILPVNVPKVIFPKVLFAVLGLLVVYTWVHDVVMKKFYLELTEEGITFRSTFRIKKLVWTEIINTNTYCVNNNRLIRLISSKDKLKPGKLRGAYSMLIPVRAFSKADPEKLFATIFNKVHETYQQQNSEGKEPDRRTEDESEKVKIEKSSRRKAAFLKIYQWVVLVFTFVMVFAYIFLLTLKINSNKPITAFLLIIVAVFSIYFLLTSRTIKKLFLKKHNGLQIKRSRRNVQIYFTDYSEFNGKEKKDMLSIAPNKCLVEIDKKNILSICIPKEITEKFAIDKYYFDKYFIDIGSFYKLDLGGQGEPRYYGYISLLIFNKSSQLELIQLDID